MNKKAQTGLIIGIIIAVVAIAGAIIYVSNPNVTGNVVNENQQKEITCNSPYIKVGSECCLDKNSNRICDNDEKSTSNQEELIKEETPEVELRISDFTIIAGWDNIINEKGDNKFEVSSRSSDALFITTLYNGEVLLDDIVETTTCNWVTGDRTIMDKFQYSGFDCLSGCANIKTKSLNIFGTTISLGEKIRLERDGNARLSFRFSVDGSRGEVLVSEPTTVRCEISVFSGENPNAFDQRTVEIDFL